MQSPVASPRSICAEPNSAWMLTIRLFATRRVDRDVLDSALIGRVAQEYPRQF